MPRYSETPEQSELRAALAVLRHLSSIVVVLLETEPNAARDVLLLGLRDVLRSLN